MKKTIWALLAAITFLTGCQDEKPAETTATETPIIKDNQLAEVTDAMLVPEKQADDGQGISTETFVDNGHNEDNTLDWSGTYLGMLPCADCPGIHVSITLHQDSTYEIEQTYQDRDTPPLASEGNFIWNESKDTITLTNEDVPNQYFVGEDVLMKLDMHGEIVTGELSANYNLFKEE